MLALVIVVCILLAIFFLLLLPIRLSVSYETEVEAEIRFLFFRFPLYPKKQKKIQPRDYSKKKLRKKKKTTKNSAQPTQKKKKKTALETLRTVRLLLYIFKNVYERFFSAFSVRVCRLQAIVATGDAAKTAILYGGVCQGVSYLLEAIRNITGRKVKEDDVTVFADFLGEHTTISLHIVLSSTPWHILLVALRATTSFLKFNKTEKAKTVTEVSRYE